MPLNIHKRGKIWHYVGTIAGRRLRGSTQTTDKKTAQRIAAKVEADQWSGHLDGPGSQLTFAQAAMAYREAEKSTRFLEKIEDHWQDTPVREMTAGSIRQSAMRLYPNAGPATRNRQVIVTTQAVINHCAELEWCSKISVRRFKTETKIKQPVDLDWVNTFAAHAAPHLGALCLFMFGTGARVGEAVNLIWDDVDLRNGTALIRQTKVGDQRTANLPPKVLAAIANIPSQRHSHEQVFKYVARDSARQPWNAVCKRAGIKQLSFHSCRHGFATSMLHAGVDVVTVAKMGGWKDVAMVVKTYGHAMTDPTITNVLFDTKLTQPRIQKHLSR